MNNPHVTCSDSLVTTSEARRTGFLRYALRRNEESVPYIDQAKALKVTLETQCKEPKQLLTMRSVREPILSAAGASVKARSYLTDADQDNLIEEFIEKVLEPSGDQFVDELVCRYLLTMGDALGGKMRNITGSLAQEKLTRYIIAQLDNKGMSYEYCLGDQNKFTTKKPIDTKKMYDVKAIQWSRSSSVTRTLVYNKNVPQVRKNIDIVLLGKKLDSTKANDLKKILSDRGSYSAIGCLLYTSPSPRDRG